MISIFLFLYLFITESHSDGTCGITQEIPNDLRTKAPWAAAIFVRSNDNSAFKYLVSGTVIGHSTILTVFGKAFGDALPDGGGHYKLPSPSNTLVVSGLKSTNFEDWDEQTQLSQINYIAPYRNHHPSNKDYHFVLIHLRTPLNLETPHVKPICLNSHFSISFLNSYRISQSFKFIGFTTVQNLSAGDNQVFRINDVILHGKSTCENLFKQYYQGFSNHVFCGELVTSRSGNDCVLSHGSALVTQLNGKWYLKGVSALIPQKRWGYCGQNTTYFFADPSNVVPWIEKNLECGPNKFFCTSGCVPLHKVCNGDTDDCDDPFENDENPIFCKATSRCPSTSFQCGLYGICLSRDKLCNKIQECTDGIDELFNVCRRYKIEPNSTTQSPQIAFQNSSLLRKSCQRLQVSEGVVAECKEFTPTEGLIDCNDAKIGVQVSLSCADHYRSTYRLPTITMTCQNDGSWGPFKPFACAPDCGKFGSGFQLNVANGKKSTSEAAFPWYAAIFVWDGMNYTFICGGSLVERSALITAAHCVGKDNGERTDVELFRIVFSPVSSDFSKNAEDRFTLIGAIKEVFVPNSYNPRILQSDIAIMILKSPVTFGDFILPICYLVPAFDEIPDPRTIGKIAGFGIDETSKISKILKYVNLPVVSSQECNTALDKVVPLNTFCAGHTNGTAVCKGDSGGGLAFPDPHEPTRYVLKGIVSHSKLQGNRLCDLENYAIFTHVDAFSKWILEILAKFQ